MKLFSEGKSYKLYEGNMLDMLEVIEPNSIESIVTDPPYELGFMAKSWDSTGIAFQPDTWKKCLDVLKPGGYLLAFGGSRTFHRIACAIEDAGFEIRDTIMWLYSTGFPKSMSISKGIEAKETYGVAGTVYKKKIELACEGETYTVKQTNNGAMGELKEFERKNYVPTSALAKQWDGWGTCLKPAYEPIIIARKPCEGSCIDNVINYGVGGINIDECRIPFLNDKDYKITADKNQHADFGTQPLTGNIVYGDYSMVQPKNYESDGRFPSNVILTYDDQDYAEVCGGMPYNKTGDLSPYQEDEGSAARYFYCAKASVKDREEGLDDFPVKQSTGDGDGIGDYLTEKAPHKNFHPTLKPCTLMQYLIRLVTPKGGTVLDPFNGSGSTGKACMYENRERDVDYKYIGIEITEEYLPISDARIKYVENLPKQFKLF